MSECGRGSHKKEIHFGASANQINPATVSFRISIKSEFPTRKSLVQLHQKPVKYVAVVTLS